MSIKSYILCDLKNCDISADWTPQFVENAEGWLRVGNGLGAQVVDICPLCRAKILKELKP